MVIDYSFLEPLESSSTQAYLEMARAVFDYYLQGRVSAVHVKEDITRYMKNFKTLFYGIINLDQSMIHHFGIMQKL